MSETPKAGATVHFLNTAAFWFEQRAAEAIEDSVHQAMAQNARNTRAAAARIAAMEEALRKVHRAMVHMSNAAFDAGLEGTKEWDAVAGGADLHGTIDAISAVLLDAEQQRAEQVMEARR